MTVCRASSRLSGLRQVSLLWWPGGCQNQTDQWLYKHFTMNLVPPVYQRHDMWIWVVLFPVLLSFLQIFHLCFRWRKVYLKVLCMTPVQFIQAGRRRKEGWTNQYIDRQIDTFTQATPTHQFTSSASSLDCGRKLEYMEALTQNSPRTSGGFETTFIF